MAVVLGCLLMRKKDNEGYHSLGLTRLHKILIIEAAHLIWSLRCERVIAKDGDQHATMEIVNRWNGLIKNRANLDIKMTDRKLGKKAIHQLLMIETWEETGIVDLSDLIDAQLGDQSGVLVGSRPSSRRGIG